MGDLDEIEKGDALIRVFHRTDPDELADEQWARRANEAVFIVKFIAESFFGKPKT